MVAGMTKASAESVWLERGAVLRRQALPPCIAARLVKSIGPSRRARRRAAARDDRHPARGKRATIALLRAAQEELALVKRRLFVAKAARVDTSKLQLEFEELLGKLAKLAGESACARRIRAVRARPQRTRAVRRIRLKSGLKCSWAVSTRQRIEWPDWTFECSSGGLAQQYCYLPDARPPSGDAHCAGIEHLLNPPSDRSLQRRKQPSHAGANACASMSGA
jgi:hypothetical protein